MFNSCRRRRHQLAGSADVRELFYQVLNVAGDGGENNVAEGRGERTRENCAVVAANTSCRRIHCHLELAHKINAQNWAVHLTLNKVKAEAVRAGGAVAED